LFSVGPLSVNPLREVQQGFMINRNRTPGIVSRDSFFTDFQKGGVANDGDGKFNHQ